MLIWSGKIVHPPIIERETFHKVQAMIGGRATAPAGTSAPTRPPSRMNTTSRPDHQSPCNRTAPISYSSSYAAPVVYVKSSSITGYELASP
jgi:hypothetical protein